MNPNIQILREKVKKYIDTADERVLSMVYALLEDNTKSDWWVNLPDDVRKDLEDSISQAGNGQTMTQEEVNRKFPQWYLE